MRLYINIKFNGKNYFQLKYAENHCGNKIGVEEKGQPQFLKEFLVMLSIPYYIISLNHQSKMYTQNTQLGTDGHVPYTHNIIVKKIQIQLKTNNDLRQKGLCQMSGTNNICSN